MKKIIAAVALATAVSAAHASSFKVGDVNLQPYAGGYADVTKRIGTPLNISMMHMHLGAHGGLSATYGNHEAEWGLGLAYHRSSTSHPVLGTDVNSVTGLYGHGEYGYRIKMDNGWSVIPKIGGSGESVGGGYIGVGFRKEDGKALSVQPEIALGRAHGGTVVRASARIINKTGKESAIRVIPHISYNSNHATASYGYAKYNISSVHAGVRVDYLF